jgi:tRNA G18 (ribose-2'-O)-methylase SpoU
MITLRIIAVDMRSTHNVGALLRTADCLGVDHVYLCGTSPHPKGQKNDDRLPHIKDKLHAQIHKTALGAEDSQSWSYHDSVYDLVAQLKADGWHTVALEQDKRSVQLAEYKPLDHTVLLLGTEVTGIPTNVLDLINTIVEIPMHGTKESLNVVQAAAIACYELLQA